MLSGTRFLLLCVVLFSFCVIVSKPLKRSLVVSPEALRTPFQIASLRYSERRVSRKNERAVISLCLSTDSRTGENVIFVSKAVKKICEFHINDYICKDKKSP